MARQETTNEKTKEMAGNKYKRLRKKCRLTVMMEGTMAIIKQEKWKAKALVVVEGEETKASPMVESVETINLFVFRHHRQPLHLLSLYIFIFSPSTIIDAFVSSPFTFPNQ